MRPDSHGGTKKWVQCACWGFGSFFLKRTIEGSNRYNCRHNPNSAARFCPFKRSRLALSEPRHTLKCSNVLLNFVFSVLALPSTASPKSTEINFRSVISTILYRRAHGLQARADNATEIDSPWIPVDRTRGRGQPRERRTGSSAEHCCIMHVCLGSDLAESQPQVLKWAPVCSESGVV